MERDNIQIIDTLENVLPICKDIIFRYCEANNIDDVYNIHPSIWSDILDELCNIIIKPNIRLLRPDNPIRNEYDDNKVLCIYNIYKKLCRIHIQEICLQGFITFTGIDKQTILNWRGGGASSTRIDLHQKIFEDNEQSLSELMIGDRGIPTKYLAKLNRYHSWNLPGVSKEPAKQAVLSAAELPKLSDYSRINERNNVIDTPPELSDNL